MPQQDKAPIVTARSSGSDWSTPPAPDQIELTLFGPGFGECAVIHLGGDHWIVVDSCQSAQSQTPVALEYLQSLGRDPGRCVALVVATHWHDDHIKGLNTLVEACPSAVFSCSAALGTKQFQSMIMAFDGQRMITGGSGVREVNGVFSTLQQRPSSPARLASASKILLSLDTDRPGHAHPVKVVALSPSDHEHTLALAAIGTLMPTATQTQYRCPPEEPNLMSIALHIQIGTISLLLGADLEQHADARRGWTAVLADTTLPKDKSTIFKVPHYGSSSSVSAAVWDSLVASDPIAVTTPWVRGAGRLPLPADIGQILSRTPHAYITAMPVTGRSAVHRPAMVQRTLREMGARIQRLQPPVGGIRLRNGGPADWNTWRLELRDPAQQLTQADAA